MHGDLGPKLAEIMHEIEGETVVIVDQNDHDRTSLPLLDTRAQGGSSCAG
jgi:hypothetical protein